MRFISTHTNPVAASRGAITGSLAMAIAFARATEADFDGDGLPDIVSGRFWERADLNALEAPRKLDLLAGDTDGFIWFFRNQGERLFPEFGKGERLRADGNPISLAANGGHARFDVCDWNSDGRKDVSSRPLGVGLFCRRMTNPTSHLNFVSAGRGYGFW